METFIILSANRDSDGSLVPCEVEFIGSHLIAQQAFARRVTSEKYEYVRAFHWDLMEGTKVLQYFIAAGCQALYNESMLKGFAQQGMEFIANHLLGYICDRVIDDNYPSSN